MRKGKLRRNRLDERQEQKMLQIEHNGCWIAFWGLAISLFVGIYLDTDVEVIKRFDPLLNLEGFVGFESKGLVAFGQGFGAKKGNRMIRAMRDRYEDLRFRLDNGECDLTASTS